MDWIYLSPHFDDIALSCGGLVWEQVQAGNRVGIWTICAGKPPPGPLSPFAELLHARWETGPAATAQRQAEDSLSCQRLGADFRRFSVPDCIYRRSEEKSGEHLYTSDQALNGPLHPGEVPLVERLQAELEKLIPPQATVVCPLTLGKHVDHQLTRAAAEKLNRPLLYYADFPYVLAHADELSLLLQQGWKATTYPISEPGLAAWQDSIQAHASQISTFWLDIAAMRTVIQAYCEQNNGIRLWQPG
jgi:LmbE family N-acetylglucosaminyl deacetylase